MSKEIRSTAAQPAKNSGNQFPSRLIFIAVVTRVFIDTSVQIFFPYLGFIAQGVNTSERLLSRLIGLRSFTGLLSPIFGNIADRHGYRLVMSGGLLASGVGYLIVAASSSWPVMAAGLFLAGIGTFAFGPNLSAYLSGQLPFHLRSRGLGMVEYAWALAGILGLSLIGWLIELTNWRVPFVILGVVLLIASGLYQLLPAAESRSQQRKKPASSSITSFFDMGHNARSTWSVMAAGFCIGIAGFSLLISHGVWLQNTFGLSAGNLGVVAFFLGLSDLLGSGLVSLIGDRLGKRRSVLIGSTLGLIGYLMLPLFETTLIMAVIGIFIARSSFEFSIVGNMILLSEQAPDRRGKALTLGASFSLLGSVLASFLAVELLNMFGILGISLFGASTFTAAIFLTRAFVRESA